MAKPPLRRDDAIGSAAINSATFGLDQNLIAAMNGLFGPGEFGQAYQKALLAEQARQAALKKAYPTSTLIGEALGGVAPLLAGGEVLDAAMALPKVARYVKPVAQVLSKARAVLPKAGLAGATVDTAGIAGRNAAIGGAFAGANDVGQGKWGLPDVLPGAGWGAAFGTPLEAVAPYAARAAAPLANAAGKLGGTAVKGVIDYINDLSGKIPGADNPVLQRVTDMVKNSGHTPATLQAAVDDASQHGAPVTLAHILDKGQVTKLANDASVNPQGKAALDAAKQDYAATASATPTRVAAHMDNQIAPGANDYDTVANLQAQLADRAKQNFEASLYAKDGSHIMLSPDGEANKVLLNPKLEPFAKTLVEHSNAEAALQNAQGLPVTGPSFQSHLEGPFSVKQASEMQRAAARMSDKYADSDPQLSAFYKQLHDGIGDGVELERPGYNAAVQINNDLTKTGQLLREGRDAFDMDPADIAAKINDPAMTDVHQTAFKIGALRGLKDKVASGEDVPNMEEALRAMGLQDPETLTSAIAKEGQAAVSPLPDKYEPPTTRPGLNLFDLLHPTGVIKKLASNAVSDVTQARESATAARTVPLVTSKNPAVIQSVIDGITDYANIKPAQRAAQSQIGSAVAAGLGTDESNYPGGVSVVEARPATPQELMTGPTP